MQKLRQERTVPETIDPVFTKTSQNARFLLSENERFGLVFVKTGSINSGNWRNTERWRKDMGEREIKIEFLLWLHDMEKPVPKPVPKAGSLFCMETTD